jgi:hypothetical protein
VRGKHYKKFREEVTVQLIGENVNARVVMIDDAKDFSRFKTGEQCIAPSLQSYAESKNFITIFLRLPKTIQHYASNI